VSEKQHHPQELLAQLFKHVDPALLGLTPAELSELLSKLTTAARRGGATQAKPSSRWQDQMIEQQIPDGASVLDLGCGNGELLAKLMRSKSVHGQGVELDPQAVFECVARGVPVFQTNLDAGLKGFSDQSFDYVILEETVQTLHQPVAVLNEMVRVGRRGIVSFPNFAYWRVRLELAIQGRMPVTESLPYHWYDTPNIHLLSLQDFLEWAKASKVRIVEAHVMAESRVRPLEPNDNLYAEESLLVIQRM
jgi:methionine biosynthesis protein MetW